MTTRRYSQEQRQAELLSRIEQDIPASVQQALREDLGGEANPEHDLTAQLLPNDTVASAVIITREAGVFCGQRWVDEVFRQLGNVITIDWLVHDGDVLTKKSTAVSVTGVFPHTAYR
ncbi:hypothetical protein OS12_30390 [Dickeya oryzae]